MRYVDGLRISVGDGASICDPALSNQFHSSRGLYSLGGLLFGGSLETRMIFCIVVVFLFRMLSENYVFTPPVCTHVRGCL